MNFMNHAAYSNDMSLGVWALGHLSLWFTTEHTKTYILEVEDIIISLLMYLFYDAGSSAQTDKILLCRAREGYQTINGLVFVLDV
jgi:hypothetical protein